MRFFDIDHGNPLNQGPEVMQFKCTGGTFTLYGYEEEDTGHDGEFLVHMSTLAKALKRNDTDEKTANDLPIHVFDCPDDEWVTLWSSRRGKQSDNPVTSIVAKDNTQGTRQPDGTRSTVGKEQERSMVQIDFAHKACFDVIFANMPQSYQHVDHNDNGNATRIQRLLDGLELNAANYPDVGTGSCPYDVAGRNWLFGGYKGYTQKVCTSPPMPPPPSPPPSPPPALPTTAPTVAPTSSFAPTATPSAAPTIAPTIVPNTPVTVGNDPLVKMDGGLVKFQLTPGVLSPLLSWTSADGATKYALKGATFNATELIELQDAQWFSQLVLTADNKPMLKVLRGEDGFGHMDFEIDGRRQRWKPKDHGEKWTPSYNRLEKEGKRYSSSKSSLSVVLKEGKRHVDETGTSPHGKKVVLTSQLLEVKAPGFGFSIESRPAMKFDSAEQQVRYGHLNLKFDKEALPKASKGFLAQLAGLQDMTKARERAFKVTDLRNKKSLVDALKAEDAAYATVPERGAPPAGASATEENTAPEETLKREDAAKKPVDTRSTSLKRYLARKAAAVQPTDATEQLSWETTTTVHHIDSNTNHVAVPRDATDAGGDTDTASEGYVCSSVIDVDSFGDEEPHDDVYLSCASDAATSLKMKRQLVRVANHPVLSTMRSGDRLVVKFSKEDGRGARNISRMISHQSAAAFRKTTNLRQMTNTPSLQCVDSADSGLTSGGQSLSCASAHGSGHCASSWKTLVQSRCPITCNACPLFFYAGTKQLAALGVVVTVNDAPVMAPDFLGDNEAAREASVRSDLSAISETYRLSTYGKLTVPCTPGGSATDKCNVITVNLPYGTNYYKTASGYSPSSSGCSAEWDLHNFVVDAARAKIGADFADVDVTDYDTVLYYVPEDLLLTANPAATSCQGTGGWAGVGVITLSNANPTGFMINKEADGWLNGVVTRKFFAKGSGTVNAHEIGHQLGFGHAAGFGDADMGSAEEAAQWKRSLANYGDHSSVMGNDNQLSNSWPAPARWKLGAIPESQIVTDSSYKFSLAELGHDGSGEFSAPLAAMFPCTDCSSKIKNPNGTPKSNVASGWIWLSFLGDEFARTRPKYQNKVIVHYQHPDTSKMTTEKWAYLDQDEGFSVGSSMYVHVCIVAADGKSSVVTVGTDDSDAKVKCGDMPPRPPPSPASPSPSPPPPGNPVPSRCSDMDPSGITLGNAMASCSELLDYCGDDFVKSRCRQTCEYCPACADTDDTGVKWSSGPSSGMSLSCQDLVDANYQGGCSLYNSVGEKCPIICGYGDTDYCATSTIKAGTRGGRRTRQHQRLVASGPYDIELGP